LRVFVTGMGGELGSRVAAMLESSREVEAVAGVDVEPPRRRLRAAHFTRIDPRDRVRSMKALRELRPTALVHLGIYEPHARSSPRRSAERTIAGTVAVLDAAVALGGLQSIVVRSGVEVYGRARGRPLVPDESVRPDATTPFGQTLLRVEDLVAASGVPAAVLRLAPVVGPHVPSPLGRYLRLPGVGFAALSDPPFSVLHQEDAARAIVHALLAGVEGRFNVVAPGAVTASQAARLGSRVPIPVAGPAGWAAVRRVAELAGAPVPDHLVELLRRGRSADGGRFEVECAFTARSTPEVIRELFEWAPVTPLRAAA
jgi:UDP-glucose 4-epimerase